MAQEFEIVVLVASISHVIIKSAFEFLIKSSTIRSTLHN